MQRGQLIQASGTIYIRFYRDGKRIAEKLCNVDDVHYGPKSKVQVVIAHSGRTVMRSRARKKSEDRRDALTNSAASRAESTHSRS
jgi:hypothetical protein